MNINRETFEAWLLSRSRDEKFYYLSNCDCLVARFVCTQTGRPVCAGETCFRFIDDESMGIDGSIPLWLMELLNTREKDGCTMGEMQDAYLKLFPDTILLSGEPEALELEAAQMKGAG